MTDQLAEQVGDPAGDDSSPGAADVTPAVTPPSRLGRWRERRRNRVTKWDRPPDPHDWRFFVGGLGKILITTGLLMFGFVAYQLWGTGIETARAQNKLEHQFEELIAASQSGQPDPASATTVAPTVAPTVPVTAPSSTVESSTAQPPETEPARPPATTVAPPTTAPVAVDQAIPAIERGQVLARLEIPKIGKTGGDSLYVVPGVTLDDLKKGPGHYPNTPLPGQLGNAAIAGHRTTFGAPFGRVDELEPGDEIIVTMLTGDRFVYAVTTTEIVTPADSWVIATRDPGVAELTLTSCDPEYTAKNRIAVHAVLVAEESAEVGVPTFYDLEQPAQDAGEVTGDETSAPDSVPTDEETSVVEASTTDESTTESTSESSTGSTTDSTTEDPTDEDSAAIVGDDEREDEQGGAADTSPAGEVIDDAFAEGWFHDSAAWPQIAMWAAALIVIALAVRRVNRHFRRHWVGLVAGVAPFVVCLYFFYQNVNRLLPPGI